MCHSLFRNSGQCPQPCQHLLAGRAPIQGVNALRNMAVKCGVRPIFRRVRQSVFHRIEVNVMEVLFVVVRIANGVFPITWLKHSSSALLLLCGRNMSLSTGPVLREPSFDPCPSLGVFRVILRQRPKAMQMVRQQDDRGDIERPSLATIRDGRTKKASGRLGTQDALSPVRDDGKEIGATGAKSPAEIRHGMSVPAPGWHAIACPTGASSPSTSPPTPPAPPASAVHPGNPSPRRSRRPVRCRR